MREIQLNMYHALALGAVMYWLGAALTRKLPALRRFCVPAPLVGGLCFALFNTLLYASGLAVITFDETLETVFMILFFTTVGFTVSIPMLVKSGRSVMLLLALSIVTILLTGVFGYLSIRGEVTPDQFLTVFTVVIAFYFGTQAQKRAEDAGHE